LWGAEDRQRRGYGLGGYGKGRYGEGGDIRKGKRKLSRRAEGRLSLVEKPRVRSAGASSRGKKICGITLSQTRQVRGG